MQSLLNLFRYGLGPSSSHTMGPHRAATMFRDRCTGSPHVRVHLYGSLSLTGRGHLTDKAILAGLKPLESDIVWHEEALPFHPNGMMFESITGDKVTDSWTVFSIGGGELREENAAEQESPNLYEQKNMEEILNWALTSGMPIWKLADQREKDTLRNHLEFVWEKMCESIDRGIATEGALPGGLNLQRKAPSMLARSRRLRKADSRTGTISAYALAVAEENGSGGYVVTAPTCGSCGVVPGVLYFLHHNLGYSTESILHGLATAGIVGNIVKQNASIAGAEVGCQGEIGVASAMAAAAAAQILGGTPRHVEYAAEIGLEHHLGLTCDPVMGLVQIPCIERNAFASVKALACAEYALLTDGTHHVSFDQVVEVMKSTGHDLPCLYRETAKGGLAKIINR